MMIGREECLPTSSSSELDAVRSRLQYLSSQPEIEHDDSTANIDYGEIHLSPDNPETPKVRVTFEKQPLQIEVDNSYENHLLVFDTESEKMLAIAAEAEKLQVLPERERPRAVLELLRRHVHYAYNDVMEAVAKDNPELAQWVAENTGLNVPPKEINLSEVFDRGYGICRHLHIAYLYLAQKAGLKGTPMSSTHESIRNIERTDTGEQLFNSVSVGEQTGNHSWAEVQLSDGTWIPVDPSTQLVGDTEEGLEMFRAANYEAPAGNGFMADAEPSDKFHTTFGEIPMFKPAETTATGTIGLLLASTKSVLRLGFKDGKGHIPPTNEPFNGKATLRIRLVPKRGMLNLHIKEMELVT